MFTHGRAFYMAILEFEKGTHIQGGAALLREGEIEGAKPRRMVHTEMVRFAKKRIRVNLRCTAQQSKLRKGDQITEQDSSMFLTKEYKNVKEGCIEKKSVEERRTKTRHFGSTIDDASE